MTTISTRTILASRNASKPDHVVRTILCRYPRWIHAEARTHRKVRIAEGIEIEIPTPSIMEDPALSRNAASSRAIPVSRMIEDVIRYPAVPIYWGANQKGMQAGEEISNKIRIDGELLTNEQAWIKGRDDAIKLARAYEKAGYHKQIINRLLEPYSHITVLITATEWENFLWLRDHPDAEPHIRALAKEIRREIETAPVQTLAPGDWHLPFADKLNASIEHRRIISSACCASTSYQTVDGYEMTIERGTAIHDKLVGSTPLHASPMEHVCQADLYVNGERWACPEQHANFVGFRQYRKMLPEEYRPG